MEQRRRPHQAAAALSGGQRGGANNNGGQRLAGNNRGGGGGGGNFNLGDFSNFFDGGGVGVRGTPDVGGPLHGEGFGAWAVRLRDVEEMVDSPELRTAVSQWARGEMASDDYRGVLSRPIAAVAEIPAVYATLRRALGVLGRMGVRLTAR